MRSLLLRLIDRWRAPAPLPNRVAWLGEWDYAHRGLHASAVPENSPAAFSDAIARGLGIECDIQRSSDGNAMVFHDWDLDRLTMEKGPVAVRSAEALARIELRGNTDRIPTLDRMLELVAGRVPLLIEIKSPDYRRGDRRVRSLCLAVRRSLDGYRGQHAVMSFDPRVARWFAVHSPRIVRGLVVTEEGTRNLAGQLRRHMALWHARPDFLAYDIRDLPSRYAAAQRKRGLPVLTWTVRDADLRERAGRYADALIVEGEGVA